MEKVRINPKNTGNDCFVTDPTQNAGANSTPVNQALANLHEAAIAGGGKFAADAAPAGNAVGGIAVNADLGGKTDHEVLEMMLYPEYAPRWKGASINTFAPVAGTLLETGSTVPTTAVANFSISTSPASAEGGSYTASGGVATNTITCNAEETGVAKNTFGTVVYTLTSVFAAGNTVVKTNKGNATNKTAGNNTTLLSAASANGSIDASTKQIKAITVTKTATINYVDAFFANGGNISSMTKLALTTASQFEVNYPSAPGSARQAFSIPASYTNVKVYVWNSMSNGGEYQMIADPVNTTSETKTLADGSTKAYTKYVIDNDNRPACKIKVTFTKA